MSGCSYQFSQIYNGLNMKKLAQFIKILGNANRLSIIYVILGRPEK